MAAVELDRFKRGDDRTFPDIVVSVAGAPQDLTEPGWTVAVQLRHFTESPINVAPVVDPDALVSSRVRLSLPRSITGTMQARTWVGDVEVTGPGRGRQSSTTFTVVIEPDVTRVDP